MTRRNLDYEYGESVTKMARVIPWDDDVRVAVDGWGALPPNFDHVKIRNDQHLAEFDKRSYYFYITKKSIYDYDQNDEGESEVDDDSSVGIQSHDN